MRQNSVRDRDLGWKRISREIERARRASVKVGVLADAGQSDDGVDLVDVAVFNEFGTSRAPARPFIRGAFDAKQRELARTQARLWDQVVRGRINAKRAIGLLGQTHEGQIKEYMTALREPPNAPSTIAQKGSSNPLIDTGRLRGSIRWENE